MSNQTLALFQGQPRGTEHEGQGHHNLCSLVVPIIIQNLGKNLFISVQVQASVKGINIF